MDRAREMSRRRAHEAALVLRNLAPEKGSLATVSKHQRVRQVIVDALAEGALEGGEDTNELRVYLLEVLETIAEDTVLLLPPTPPRVGSKAAVAIIKKPTSAADPSLALFPLLVALTRSPDRALVLASFRTLTALSTSELSSPAVSLLSYPSSSSKTPHPLHTAIELLPIADADLGAVILDYIYQHTLLPSNAVAFCARPDLVQILRLVCTKLHLGARKEVLDITLPVLTGEGEAWYKEEALKHEMKKREGDGRELSTKLDAGEVKQLATLSEPARTLAWCVPLSLSLARAHADVQSPNAE